MHWNSYGKYLLTGVVLGSFLLYAPSVTEAKRAHKAPQNSAEVTVAVPDVMNETKQAQRPSRKHQADPKIGIRQDLRGEDQLHATSEKELSGGSDFQSRIHNILYPAGQAEQQMTQLSVPQTVSAYDNSIIGTPLASQEQCVRYLLSNNPNPDITVSPQQLVSYYYEEGAREGIRPDVAFAQALKETGFFRYGGDVIPQQNNFCGLGTTGGGVKVTTFAVLILTIRSVAQGRDDCVIGGHHIESKTVYRALTIIVIGAVAAFGSAVVVYYNTAETVSVIDCIFESCSAFGTVGLSVGVTGQLNTGAKLLYMACMFMGRVGPVSLAISLTAKPDDNKRKVLPVGHINVG